ncbi:MAG: hypothetical protein ACR2LU_10095 [Luteitalea sp.]
MSTDAVDIRRRPDTAIRASGAAVVIAGFAGLLWLFVQQPASLVELTGGVAATVGVYQIDQAAFEEGRQFFAADKFPEARAAFARADPAMRHGVTQFYTAYSYYRQGWGRLYSDDALYTQGLAVVNRAIEVAPDHRVRVDDPALDIKTADELKQALESGLRREASDFNPLRVLRPRR